MTDSITGLARQLGLYDINVGAAENVTEPSGPTIDLAKERQLWDAAAPELAALLVAVYKKSMSLQDGKAGYRKIRDRIKRELMQPDGSSEVSMTEGQMG